MSESKPVELEQRAGVAILRLNRPQVHNAVDAAVVEHLEGHLETIEADPSVRVVIVTGTGRRTFSAGSDLDFIANHGGQALAISRRMGEVLERLHGGPRPVIAAINGDAWGGGCEIVTACHLRLAGHHTHFGFRQAAMGVVTGWGGGPRLIRLVGRASALRLLLTGETIDATEARRLGLVDRILPGLGLFAEAEALARRIASNAPGALAGFLELARVTDELPAEEVRAIEARRFEELSQGEHFQARVAEWRSRRENLAK